jgi:hypothetical protein
LHRLTPDGPLPNDGRPFPDETRQRCRPRLKPPANRDLIGFDAARILADYFAGADAHPRQLVGRFSGEYLPIHHNEHIAAAAAREGVRARLTGRWLVRRGTETDDVVIGLALLAAVGTVEDIPYIQTIGLLSNTFGPLAAEGLERLPGGAEALIWLGDRVSGWGRVYVVEALCRLAEDHPAVRPWLLVRAVNGDFLNSYFAGKAAMVAGIHEAMARPGVDAEVVDHAGRILHVLTYASGMGMDLAGYPHATEVLSAHLRLIAQLGPSAERFSVAALLARDAARRSQGRSSATWEPFRDGYLDLVNRDDWCAVAAAALRSNDPTMTWLADTEASGLALRAFRDWTPPSS